LSLVCHGNSVLDNTAMDICVLKTKPITFINGFFTDDFSIRALYFSETFTVVLLTKHLMYT